MGRWRRPGRVPIAPSLGSVGSVIVGAAGGHRVEAFGVGADRVGACGIRDLRVETLAVELIDERLRGVCDGLFPCCATLTRRTTRSQGVSIHAPSTRGQTASKKP